MSCGCGNMNKKDGKSVVDLVRSKVKADFPLATPHEIECSCGKTDVYKRQEICYERRSYIKSCIRN